MMTQNFYASDSSSFDVDYITEMSSSVMPLPQGDIKRDVFDIAMEQLKETGAQKTHLYVASFCNRKGHADFTRLGGQRNKRYSSETDPYLIQLCFVVQPSDDGFKHIRDIEDSLILEQKEKELDKRKSELEAATQALQAAEAELKKAQTELARLNKQ